MQVQPRPAKLQSISFTGVIERGVSVAPSKGGVTGEMEGTEDQTKERAEESAKTTEGDVEGANIFGVGAKEPFEQKHTKG